MKTTTSQDEESALAPVNFIRLTNSIEKWNPLLRKESTDYRIPTYLQGAMEAPLEEVGAI